MVQKGTQKPKKKVTSQKAATLSKKNSKQTDAAATSVSNGDSEASLNSNDMNAIAGSSNSHTEREEMDVDQTKNSELNGGQNEAESPEVPSETVKQPVKSKKTIAAKAANLGNTEEVSEKEKSAQPLSKTKGKQQKETADMEAEQPSTEMEEEVAPKASRSQKRKAPEAAIAVKPKETKVSEEEAKVTPEADEVNRDSEAYQAEAGDVAEPVPKSNKSRSKKALATTKSNITEQKSAQGKKAASVKTKTKIQKETTDKMETDEQESEEMEEEVAPKASRSQKRKAPEAAVAVKPKERKVSDKETKVTPEADEANMDSEADQAEAEDVAEPVPKSNKSRSKKALATTKSKITEQKSAQGKKAASVKTKTKLQKASLNIPTLKTISGKVFVIGENDVGQLGLGEDVEVKKRPAMLELPYAVVDVAAGGMHSVCLTESGEVITFGCNDEGALGRITTDEGSEFTPRKVEIRDRVVQISAGDSHSAALTESGHVYLWGNFRSGDGPMGLTIEGSKQVKPIRILNNVTIVKISSGTEHLACLSNSGKVFTVGCGENGQLGRISERVCRDGGRKGRSALLEPAEVNVTNRNKPVLVEDIWCGSYTTFLKTQETNMIFAFGLNNYNHLGFEKERVAFFPKQIPSFSTRTWLQITGGQHHTVALDSDNLVYSLGRKDYGRLGLGENCEEKSEPTVISTLENEKCSTISCGNCVSFAVTENGSVYSWGMGTNHQLGHGNDDDCHIPHHIEGNFSSSWKAFKVSGGGQHTLILASPKESAKSDKKK